MKKTLSLALTSLMLALNCHAAPASQASVEELLVVTKSESMIDSVYANLDQMIAQSMRQATQGEKLTAEQQRVMEALPAKLVALFRQEYSWATMKPQMIKIYMESLEQEDVDDLLVFYKSRGGQALINKMPVVMQKSMQLSQSMLQAILPKMRATMMQAIEEAKAAK
ncbi:DUF2059 domain-containing protein [Ideonella paludis]|uniref:DUF2059 domain-containing protein n=1 Tax=Ideonella paludis TaxID=1233411 RepID=A0ABS5DSX2_9BURK|nr:DUF2059 domain-containing protein [Ideonella paludis]MBQ0934217.1 DUF2059 domain-containing protein [Ideonella paludis]